MRYFSTQDSYERGYLSFGPMHHLMQERGMTDLQLAKKVGVKVDVIRNTYKYQDTVTLSMVRSICEVLDCGPGDLMAAGKVECIPAKKEIPDAHTWSAPTCADSTKKTLVGRNKVLSGVA